MKYVRMKSGTTLKGDYDIHIVIIPISLLRDCAQKIVPLRGIRALCNCIEVHKVKRLKVVKVRVRVGMH